MFEPDPAILAERTEAVKRYRPIEQLLPAHWTEATVQANGIAQHYYRTGPGTRTGGAPKPALVLLHGIMEGALSWLAVGQALEVEADYDLVMLDARGHGLSEGIHGNFSQEALVEDVAAAIIALGLERPHLLGFSKGGTTGIFLADRYPSLLRSLVVSGWSEGGVTAGGDTSFTQSEGYQAWLRGWTAWLTGLRTQTHAERMVASLAQLPPGPLMPEEQMVPWVENSAHLDPELVQVSMSLWGEAIELGPKMVAALDRLTVPVLLMVSEFFPAPGMPKSVQPEPSTQANVRRLRFVNTGHLIYNEQPEAFVTALAAWLDEHQ